MILWIVVRNNNYGPGYDFSYSDVALATSYEAEAREYAKKTTTMLHDLTVHKVVLDKVYPKT